MSRMLPRLPALLTLRRKPTWANRAGRVDRSACIEVRASEVRRQVEHWRIARAKRRDEQPPHAEAEGEVTLNGRWLRKLHAHRLPFSLTGDLRTRKSNAMKDPHSRAAKRRDSAKNSRANASREHFENASPSMFNPNKGASRTKLLGFFDSPSFMAGWSQTVRLVRWRSHEKLAQHFLICPSCEQKYLKLFAVLCSNQELDDAATAEAWIENIDARHAAARRPMDAAVIEFRNTLIARYALLFRKRRLVCRKCLGMRYGEVKSRAGTKPRTREGMEVDDADREQALREAQRRARRREQNREWRRVMKEGMPHVEKALRALARMRGVESLVRKREKEG